MGSKSIDGSESSFGCVVVFLGPCADALQKRIFLSVGMGGLVAVLATLAIAIVWLPSAVSTILQFRSGVIGSLRDADFSRYRKAREYPENRCLATLFEVLTFFFS